MNETLLKYYPQIIIVIGILLQVWGGTILFKRTQKYRKGAILTREKISQKSDTILDLSQKNKALNLELTKLAAESTTLGKENKSLNEQISNLSNRISEQSKVIENQVTSGDSYGDVHFIHVGYPNDASHSFSFYNNGDYPLYDVSITVRNQTLVQQRLKEKTNSKGIVTLDDLKLSKTYNLGTIPPKMSRPFGNFMKLNDNEIFYFGFSISTRNRSFSQLYKFLKKGKDYYSATYLNTIKRKNEKTFKVLIDRADKGFPGEVNGKIEWNEGK